MRYIIAYKLRRKNARRRMYSKFDAIDLLDARKQFESYMNNRIKLGCEPNKEVWELLTGDWKHICFWCDECEKETEITCEKCEEFKTMKGIGKHEGTVGL